MRLWIKILKIVIIFIGFIAIALNVELYVFCKQQRNEIDVMKEAQKMEQQLSSNKFKYQQEQIERLSKDLGESQQQIKIRMTH